MPFGLQGAPATFQRLMDRVVQGLEMCSAVYLDDLVIFSKTWEEHLQHVREVLQRLRGSRSDRKTQEMSIWDGPMYILRTHGWKWTCTS